MDLAPPPVAMMAISGTCGHGRDRLLGEFGGGLSRSGLGMIDSSSDRTARRTNWPESRERRGEGQHQLPSQSSGGGGKGSAAS